MKWTGVFAGVLFSLLSVMFMNCSRDSVSLPNSSLDIDKTDLANAGFTQMGDMFLLQGNRDKSSAQSLNMQYWPRGIVPVVFSSNVTQEQKEIFWNAANEWNQIRGGIQFVAKTSENYQLLVKAGVQGSGCNATVGYFVSNEVIPTVNLESSSLTSCWAKGVIVHELGHVLGLYHEHQRPDRDQYISLTPKGQSMQWIVTKIDEASTELPYDPTSAMHYCFSNEENYFEVKPNVQLADNISLLNLCRSMNNFKISFWDARASVLIFSKTNNQGGNGTSSSLSLTDTSYGNDKGLHITQKLKGAGGPGLRGCTTTLSQASQYCLNDSEFRVVGVAGDLWKYDSANDTYSVDFDAPGWPLTTYVSKYILPNGTRTEIRFTPMKFIDNSFGNGTTLTRIKQSLSGAGGPNLRGCTVTIAQAHEHCVNDSEFRVIGVAGDVWIYDAATDTYSVDFAAPSWWTQTTYVTRYILPDGRRFELSFTPARP